MTLRGPLAIALFVVLIVSLAANFVVIGFVASRVGEFRLTGIERLVALGVRSYPPEIRRAIVEGAASNAAALGPALAGFSAARTHAFDVMRADPFDAPALDAAFADVRQKTEVLQRLGQEVIAKAVAGATPDTRARIRDPKPLHQ